MIRGELAEFLKDGLGIHIGTRDTRMQPNGARAVAVTVEDREHLLVYVSKAAVQRVLPDLEENGHVAIVLARPTDERACQIKGRFVDVRPARTSERVFLAVQWDRFLQNLERIGIPRAGSANWSTWPAVAIRIRVTEVFDQTPGPSAGAPLS